MQDLIQQRTTRNHKRSLKRAAKIFSGLVTRLPVTCRTHTATQKLRKTSVLVPVGPLARSKQRLTGEEPLQQLQTSLTSSWFFRILKLAEVCKDLLNHPGIRLSTKKQKTIPHRTQDEIKIIISKQNYEFYYTTA